MNSNTNSSKQRPPASSVFYISGFGSDLARKKSIIASRMRSTKDSSRDSHIKDLESHSGATGPRNNNKKNQNNNNTSSRNNNNVDDSAALSMKRDFSEAKSSVVIPNKKAKMQLYRKDCDRSSYMSDLKDSSYGKTLSFENNNPNFTPKPDMAALSAKRSRTPSSVFKSKTTETRDSYIKESPQMKSDGVDFSPHRLDIATESKMRSKTPSAVFRSKTTVGDAHIRAVPKQLDVVVAYREMAGPK